ncbi:hypothetical protein BKA62DRAFT_685333 [Auriculariales sp. MPI-PUGE-AT-0066]|nr:hypothetical protein BKA62DRAFT_685333 [Auriculariales sp. MPI-PUGE-AT-0066]
MRFSLTTIVFSLATVFAGVQAAPVGHLESRQLGNLTCNIARLRIVAALARTTSGTEKLQGLTAGDDAALASVDDALTGLQGAAGGIRTIAGALISGETAPADARDQVGSGLTQAKAAFSSITSTDPDVTTQVAAVQKNLDSAIAAGEDVVANCK